jgi:hypothetical protein
MQQTNGEAMKHWGYYLLLSTIVLLSASRLSTTRAEEVGPQPHVASPLLNCSFERDDWWQEWGLREQPKNTSLVSGPGIDGDSSQDDSERYLRVVVREGQHMGTSFAYKFRDQVGEEPDEVYLRYDIKFDEDWRHAMSGGKLPGFGGTYGRAGWGGRPVDGSDGWSARGLFDSRPGGDSTDIGFYCYHADMKGKYGSHFEFTPKLSHGRWYTVKMHCKLNTPGTNGGRGKNDGVLRGWIDGQLAFEKTDLRFRDVASLKIENIWMNVYHGGATPVPDQDIHLYLDNVVISREP